MTVDARTTLKTQLPGGHDALDDLSPDEASDLLQMFTAARAFEGKALEAAIDETISALPRLFRGTARAIVFPKGK
ncbi:hypothetical protein [Smaragdicoccus niigatensis]|uniref:hypothetical protein n=1 Tax=Smaragdicoccus niigatensis TaxID=359359 RepID=UPI00036E309A|nr:hypothetical protein [Smaragdicoccus niigatensis]